jgi:hypothetical protein
LGRPRKYGVSFLLDARHQILPGFDEPRGALFLQLPADCVIIEPGIAYGAIEDTWIGSEPGDEQFTDVTLQGAPRVMLSSQRL